MGSIFRILFVVLRLTMRFVLTLLRRVKRTWILLFVLLILLRLYRLFSFYKRRVRIWRNSYRVEQFLVIEIETSLSKHRLVLLSRRILILSITLIRRFCSGISLLIIYLSCSSFTVFWLRFSSFFLWQKVVTFRFILAHIRQICLCLQQPLFLDFLLLFDCHCLIHRWFRHWNITCKNWCLVKWFLLFPYTSVLV